MEYTYLLTICIILVSTKVFSLFTGKFQMPQVVGALFAGLLLGPAMLNVLQPSEFLHNLAELGVIVIMFGAGMETSLDDLKKSGKMSFLVALFGVIIPLGLGALLSFGFNKEGILLEHIFIGVVLTATSVSITVETLKELGKLSTKVGNTILAAALIDDILGLICLTIVTSLGGSGVNIFVVIIKILLFFVFAIAVGMVSKKFFDWMTTTTHNHNLHRFPVAAFALCLFMSWSAEVWFGVADIIGAFAAGVIISMTPKGHYIASKFSPLSYLLLTPIFFANIGLGVVLPEMDTTLIIFSVLLVIIAILSKLIGCGAAAKIAGFNIQKSIQIGLGMACRGEVALIVANKGRTMGLLPDQFFGPIIIMVVCCAVFTPILLKQAFKQSNVHNTHHVSSLTERFHLRSLADVTTHDILINKNDTTSNDTLEDNIAEEV
ncbi:sodium:proton antiporter [Candidatus Epulonipiscium fishelsonii]|uniref:Sodium:proton antiporter n=1 Tax=Candidatus Epulonipiscium fishelsonii TaxID=77094 RepID=A0ACC8XF75_9FIRM|nr:sodium:proton antiporter [Epulopiscium sp. SCG-B11WGA-EpuloA1]